MKAPTRSRTWLLASLLCVPLLCSCAEPASPPVEPEPPDTLPRGGWGSLVKVLDAWTIYEKPPRLARGGLVHAKVVVGHVQVTSSDPSVLTIESTETRDVGTWCVGDRCERDYDTWFTMIGVAEGIADLIVRNPAGDERRLRVIVAERHSASVRMTRVNPDYVEELVVDEGLVFDAEPPCDGLFGLWWLWVDLRDDQGRGLITHTTWTIQDPGIVEFLPLYSTLGVLCAGRPTRDVFVEYEPLRLEGPKPILWPMGAGETTLRIETTEGFEIEIPVEVAGEFAGELPSQCGEVDIDSCLDEVAQARAR